MTLQITASEKNKTIFYTCVLLVFPLVYNKLGYRLTWNKLEIWSMEFFWLYISMLAYMFIGMVNISYRGNTFWNSTGSDAELWKILGKKLTYYVYAVVPLIFSFMLYTLIWIWPRDEFWEMFWMNIIWRVSILTFVFFGIAYLFKKDTAWTLPVHKTKTVEVVREVKVKEEVIKEVVVKHEVIKERVVEKIIHIEVPKLQEDGSGLQKKIALNEMYTYLVHEAGVGPLFNGLTMIRFFDIVAVKTQHRQLHVIFSDGSMVLFNDIWKVLEEHGLRHWFVKISDNYFINMLLVDFPFYNKKSKLILHTESITGLLRKMSAEEIDTMLTFGKGISVKKIDVFYKNRNALVHDGWDTWITITK